MEMFNTEFTIEIWECDRQDCSGTDFCSGNTLHLGGGEFRAISLLIVIIHDVGTMKTLTGNSITWFVMSGGGHLQNMEIIRFSEDLGKKEGT